MRFTVEIGDDDVIPSMVADALYGAGFDQVVVLPADAQPAEPTTPADDRRAEAMWDALR